MTTEDDLPLAERVSLAPQESESGAMTLAGYVTYKATIRRDLDGDEALAATANTFLCPPEDYGYSGEPLEELGFAELGYIAQGWLRSGERAGLELVKGVLHESARRLSELPLETTISVEVHAYLATIGFAQDTIAYLEGQQA